MEKETEILNENDTVFVTNNERNVFIRVGDIRIIESHGNESKIFFKYDTIYLRKSLKAIHGRLNNNIFIRANRQQIVNTRLIEKVEDNNGKLCIYTGFFEEIYLSRRAAINFNRL